MNELFYYVEETDELKSLGELTEVEFLSAVEDLDVEVDMRLTKALEALPPFELSGEITADVDLRFRLAFKSWAGLVPRKIGVWA